jgi:hypothetical protein
MADFPRPVSNPHTPPKERRGFPAAPRSYSVMDQDANQNIWLNRARALGQGMTFGTEDEITAAISAAMAAAKGYNFKDAYDEIINKARKEYKGYSERNPEESIPLEIIGGIPTGKGVSTVVGGLSSIGPRTAKFLTPQTLSRASAEGGAMAAMYGIGTGEDSLSNRLNSAATQAWQGATAAPVIAGGTNLLKHVGKAGKDIVLGTNHEKEADKFIKEALRFDGVPLSNITTGKLYEHGGPNMDSLIAASGKSSGFAPKAYADEAARLRDAAHGDTVDIVQKNIMPIGSTYDVSDPAEKVIWKLKYDPNGLKAQASTLYEQAMSPGTPLYDPELMKIAGRLVDTPAVMKDALEAGTLTGKRYPIVWSKSPDPSKLSTGATREVNGVTQYAQIVPDLRFWDSVKKSLWNHGKESSNKQLYGGIRKELTDTLDNHPAVPKEYKVARKLYEENAGLEEAHQAGIDMFKKDKSAWGLNKDFNGIPGVSNGYTQAEQELFLHGLSGKIVDDLGTSPEAAKELAKALSAPGTAQKLAVVVDSPNLQTIREGVGNQVARLEKADLMTPPVQINLNNSGQAQENLQKFGTLANIMSGISPGSISNSVARARVAHAMQDNPELSSAISARLLQDSQFAIPGITGNTQGFLSSFPKVRAGLDAITPNSATMTGQFVGSEPAIPRESWEDM